MAGDHVCRWDRFGIVRLGPAAMAGMTETEGCRPLPIVRLPTPTTAPAGAGALAADRRFPES